jgi:hypothetical protein
VGVFLRAEIFEKSELNEAAAAYSLWSFNPIPPVFVRKIRATGSSIQIG